MRNKTNFNLRAVLADRIKQLYLKNYSSKSMTIEDFKNTSILYANFKECSLCEKSLIDDLVKEMYEWNITGII